jgi:hypothetical protein
MSSAAGRPPEAPGSSGERAAGSRSKYQERKDANKETRETVVKCALGQRVERPLRAAIEGLVEDVSKAAHKAHLCEMARGASVKTDGVSLCVLYRVQLPPAEQARAAATDTSAKRHKLAKTEAAAAKAAAKTVGPQRAPPLLAGQRVIAFDPGRRTLLYGVEPLANGKLKKHALSRGASYSGMGTRNATAQCDGAGGSAARRVRPQHTLPWRR